MRLSPLVIPALFAASSSAAASLEATILCSQLQSEIPSRVELSVDPSGSNFTHSAFYDEATNRYWNLANSDDKPACVLYPESAQDVSIAMRLLHAAPTVPFALKSGGHNRNRGFSSTDGGVLITFRPNMNYTRPSEDLNSAEVGPGARWNEVMEVLDEVDRCAVGGRSGDVGVGGFIAYGGISYLNSQYGFASDNVLAFEVVLANGTIVNATSTVNEDLFWALRGGGNVFGVITKFTLQTHPIGDVWGGMRVYDSQYAPELISAITNYTANFNESKSAIIPTVAFLGALNSTAIWSVFFFWDGPSPPANVFAEFNTIPSIIDETTTMRYPTLLNLDSSSGAGTRTSDIQNTLPNMPHDQMVEFMDWHVTQMNASHFLRNPSIGFEIFSVAWQPIPIAIMQQNWARGPAALSTNPAVGDQIWIQYGLGWTNSSFDEKMPQDLFHIINAAKLHQQMEYAGIEPTNYQQGDMTWTSYNPLVGNDAQVGQPVLQSFGRDAYERLKRVHRVYDPENVFLEQTRGFQFF